MADSGAKPDPDGPRDTRPNLPDDVDEWIAYAKTEADVVMLDAANQTVFVHYLETDAFDRGWTWVANSVDAASARRTTGYAANTLVREWFGEAIATGLGQAYPMALDETPIGGSHYVD